MHKLRELDKRVIGIGVQSSTSALLPPACDEFLFYDRLPGRRTRSAPSPPAAGRAAVRSPRPRPDRPATAGTPVSTDQDDLGPLVARTLAGLQRHTDGPVLASRLKRAILRKDPTFDEADHGFRGFGELLRHLESQRVVELRAGQRPGRPRGRASRRTEPAEDEAFGLLVDVVSRLQVGGARPQLSGLKNQLRKRRARRSARSATASTASCPSPRRAGPRAGRDGLGRRAPATTCCGYRPRTAEPGPLPTAGPAVFT